MRSSFFVILISLLLAFYAILRITIILLPPRDFGPPENSGEALKAALLNEAYLEHQAYLRDGCNSHQEMQRHGAILKLAEPVAGGFNILCGGVASQAFAAILQKAVTNQSLAAGPDGASWVIAYPFRIPDGRQLVIAQYSAQAPRHGWQWPRTFTPFFVSVLVALGLAYFFSRPVRELRSVVRSFAAGNLDTRVPTRGLRLPGAATNEIRSLMLDFNQMADRITALVESQKLLLRDVSHELRSPLSRMSVALEMARDQSPPAAEVHLQRIEDEADRLNLLIGELLSLSSLESLRKPMSVVPTSLVQLIETCLPNLEYEAGAQSCSIVLNSATDPTVVVNPDLLARAIENVVRNAIRYSPPGAPVEIEITTVRNQNSSSAMLRILDRGPGIPEELREAVFRPFVRVDASRSEDSGGFGVGLAIAERAIQLHSGAIRALPRPGGGLIVEIVLPALNSSSTA
jgi:two-component system sensor histidine kinase CpxA